ncbi:MAG: hypothetical protein K6G00_09115 [Treponema sp.]|nr:hypothetical protein [Treponema sp.]
MNFVKRSMVLIGTPVAILFFFTTILAASFVSKSSKNQTLSFMQSHTQKCVLELENVLQAPMKMTEALALFFREGYYKSNATTNDVFVNLSYAYPMFSGFYGCRTDKTIFKTPKLKLPDNFDPTSRGWYKGAVQKNGEMFYSDVYVDAYTKELVVTFSQAIYKNHILEGVVAFDYPLTDLLFLLGNLKTSSLDQSFILSSKGNFFMHDSFLPDENILTVENGAYEKIGSQLLSRMGEFVYGKIGGKNYVFIASEIPTTGWIYVLGKEMSELNRTTNIISFILIVIFAILFSFIMFVTAVTMKKMHRKAQKASEDLAKETQSLAVAAKENAATSQDQSAAVKEIVATMEDNNSLSESIAIKIKDVSDVAKNTNENVKHGLFYLEDNVRRLHDIAFANQSTIDEIKRLGEKIDNIWDIVTLINSVADQAKIIAFNAELEASSAGETGKNFHIVASEIRRLADGIIDGTKEIKDKINEIQQSSDSLIIASESGTERINEGCSNAKILEKRFASIKNASEITAGSAGDIRDIIQQQVMASEQILITLRQISDGVENFTSATENISAASENLKEISEKLNG